MPQMLIQHAYMELNAFYGLLQDFKMTLYTFEKKSPFLLGYKSIIMGFVNVFISTQNMSSIPDRTTILAVFSKLIEESPEMCHSFWTIDFPNPDKRSLLDVTKRAFPLNYSPLIEFLTASIGGPESAGFVISYFQNISSWTEAFDQSRHLTNGFDRSSQTIAYCQGAGLISGAVSLQLAPEKGTVAHFMARDVLLFEMDYSGFHLILCLIDSFLSTLSPLDDPSTHLHGSQENLTVTFRFLAGLFENLNKSQIHQLMEHFGAMKGFTVDDPAEAVIDLITKVLDKCCKLPSPSFDLIAYSIQCLSTLLHYYPDIIWRHLRAQSFLPKYVFSTAPRTYSNSSFLQQTLLPAERSNGRYKITLMFLRLVTDFIRDAQKCKSSNKYVLMIKLNLDI